MLNNLDTIARGILGKQKAKNVLDRRVHTADASLGYKTGDTSAPRESRRWRRAKRVRTRGTAVPVEKK